MGCQVFKGEGCKTRDCCSKFATKVETFLEQREVVFLSSIKICENLNFSTAHPEKFKFSQILMDDKNAT